MSAAIVAQAGAGLLQFLQGAISGASAAANASSGAQTTSNASSGAVATGGHHKHGGAFGKLVDAITNALQSASSSSTGSTTSSDPNQTIIQALTQIFQNGSLGSTGQTSGTTETDSTDDAEASGNTSGLPDAFVQTLKAFGVTPEQFEGDLTTALKAAQSSGSFDPSILFKSFPPGSAVDTLG
jgi:hypothetical protein